LICASAEVVALTLSRFRSTPKRSAAALDSASADKNDAASATSVTLTAREIAYSPSACAP
jgi:hypothetical protein